MSQYQRYLITGVLMLLGLFVAYHFVGAQIDSGLSQLEGTGLGTTPLIDIVYNIIRVALGLLGIIAVSIFIYAGYLYMTAGGNATNVEKARKLMINAVIGIGIILFSLSIVTFIFNMFFRAGLDGRGERQITRSGYEGGTGALGGGIIQSHYPFRNAVDVPRNTSIVITFKEPVDINQIIDLNGQTTENGVISGNLLDPVRDLGENLNEIGVFMIFHETEGVTSNRTEGTKNIVNDVQVTTSDNGRTFVFKPRQLLGSTDQNVVYTVGIRGDLRKANGTSAFGTYAANAEFAYSWIFEVSTNLDLTPPRVTSVLPRFTNDPDQMVPRNMLVQINFSEPVNPITIAGETINGFSTIVASIVEGDSLEGVYEYGNNYQTVEFRTNELCGRNSCGGDVFCLPGNEHLQVLVQTATLDNPQGDLPFMANILQGFDGVVDMANNALDGNGDNVPQGPGSPAFSPNFPDVETTSDDYLWQFYTNNTIDLIPPQITEYVPLAGQEEVDPTAEILARFDKLLSATSIKPDSNYGNGYCFCTSNNDCNEGEVCSPTKGYCTNETTGERIACYTYLPETCNLDRVEFDGLTPQQAIQQACIQPKYIDVDQSRAVTNSSEFTWYTPLSRNIFNEENFNLSYTSVRTAHGQFVEFGTYGIEYGSGIMDIFQNCYIPSAAPGCVRVGVGVEGVYSSGTDWRGVFPSCDLTDSELSVHGSFNLSYVQDGQNQLTPITTYSWTRPAIDIFDADGTVSDDFSFLSALERDNTLSFAIYHEQGTNQNQYYYLIGFLQFNPVTTTLRTPINENSSILEVESITNFPIPQADEQILITINGDEMTYGDVDIKNRQLLKVGGIGSNQNSQIDHVTGATVVLVEKGTVMFDYGPVANVSDPLILPYPSKLTDRGQGNYTVTLQWDTTAGTLSRDYFIHQIGPAPIEVTNQTLYEFIISPSSLDDENKEFFEKINVQFVHPGGVIALPNDQPFQIIQTSL